jgi:hypothetical protein
LAVTARGAVCTSTAVNREPPAWTSALRPDAVRESPRLVRGVEVKARVPRRSVARRRAA